MNSLDFYLGKSIKRSVEDTGRKPKTIHWLTAAILQANQDSVTFDEMVKMLNEINDFQPVTVSREQNLKEMGF